MRGAPALREGRGSMRSPAAYAPTGQGMCGSALFGEQVTTAKDTYDGRAR